MSEGGMMARGSRSGSFASEPTASAAAEEEEGSGGGIGGDVDGGRTGDVCRGNGDGGGAGGAAGGAAEDAAATKRKTKGDTNEAKLTYVGFCGADDSVRPDEMADISRDYPWVEWGVLFRPDKEGQPRYATSAWIKRLGEVASRNPEMRLAAHLCGSHVDRILGGGSSDKDDFLSTLRPLGFRRVQINATAVNGVDTSSLGAKVPQLARAMASHPELEFIIQRNEETRPLWETMVDADGGVYGQRGCLPQNVTLLADESKGTGVRGSSWPSPPPPPSSSSAGGGEAAAYRMGGAYGMGYAGGINPSNVASVLGELMDTSCSGGRGEFWIDMESGVRSKSDDGRDVFDLDKCRRCIDEVCRTGLKDRPEHVLRPKPGSGIK